MHKIFLALLLSGRILVEASSNCHLPTSDLTNKKSVEESQETSKKRDIIAFIRASTLQPEQMESMLSIFVKQAMASGKKNAEIEEVVAGVKKQILSDAFIERFTLPFEKTFSQEEIQLLTTFYKSEAMKKCFKYNGEFFAPIFTAFREVIQEVLNTYPSVEEKEKPDRVITLTKANYQKEVQESDLPIVLDVYANWCEPCKAVAPIFSQLSKELTGKVKFVKLDIDKEESLAKSLGIEVVPTFLFFKKGKVVQRCNGVADQNVLAVEIIKSLF